MVEQLTVNHRGLGSNPRGGAMGLGYVGMYGGLSIRVEVGSIPINLASGRMFQGWRWSLQNSVGKFDSFRLRNGSLTER